MRFAHSWALDNGTTASATPLQEVPVAWTQECPSCTELIYDTAHNDNGNTVGRDCSGRGLCDYGTDLYVAVLLRRRGPRPGLTQP